MRLSIPERACIRCRERRVKCDKGRPGCDRCAKRGLTCTGYDTSHRFLDSGARVRERYGPKDEPGSDNTPDAARTASADARSGSPPTIRPPPQAYSQLPPHETLGSAAAINSVDAEATSRPMSRRKPDALGSLDNVIDGAGQPSATLTDPMTNLDVQMDAGLEDAYFDIDPDIFYGIHNNSCGPVGAPMDLFSDVDPWEMHTFIEDQLSALGSPVTTHGTASSSSKNSIDERTTEIAYLTMHFVQSLGPWLDLFDEDLYFTRTVPSRAMNNALLRSCISAFASKQLGRLTSNTTYFEKDQHRPEILHIYPANTHTDWFYKAASYYDKAIYYLRVYLQELSSSPTPWFGDSQLPAPRDELDRALNANADQTADPPPPKKRRIEGPSAHAYRRDDLLIAVSILSGYEALDQHQAEALQHLSGFHSLLTSEGLPNSLKVSETIESRSSSSFVARRATFWNFVRADCSTAYINRIRSRLDPDDTEIWIAAGLPVTREGALSPQYFDMTAPKRLTMTEDLASRTLLWILIRIMNYIADSLNTESATNKKRQEDPRRVWDSIQDLLDKWHKALPSAFQPYAHISHLGSSLTTSFATKTPLTELLFSTPSCAAALQLYHFARILLLLNQPLESKSQHAGDHLRLFREVSKQSEFHSREICGIALGYTKHPARTPIMQPLFLAGNCLESVSDRKVVLDLLEAIERDSGCSTEYRRLGLQKQWGWEV